MTIVCIRLRATSEMKVAFPAIRSTVLSLWINKQYNHRRVSHSVKTYYKYLQLQLETLHCLTHAHLAICWWYDVIT